VIGEPRLFEPECESTQTLLLDADLPEGAIAVTDHQTAGRGRLGRAWLEPPGSSVLCSVLLRPPPERAAPELSLVAGAATAEAVEAATDLSTQLKWPNDVMLNRRKVAGILAEMRSDRVVVGIGINVNQTREQLPVDSATAAGSLRSLTGREYDRSALLARLLERLEVRYQAWRSGGFEAVYDEIGSRDFLRGRRVRHDGLDATAVMIDRHGRLVIELSGEERVIGSGDVELIGA
jgi:BirA family transcriptional regulator, biotin operon repressor / biotin---[acetyl-CoA-carboxylase] ligase